MDRRSMAAPEDQVFFREAPLDKKLAGTDLCMYEKWLLYQWREEKETYIV